ncbi:MAG: TrkH family potassium uptake protein [Lachnospiraceae bacterium]
MTEKKRKSRLSATRVIMLGFFVTLMLGSVLLMLPISVKPGVTLEYVDALFISASSVCVTGLTTVVVADTFTTFGQVVILCLIQVGGLGIVTFTTGMLLLLGRKITLSERLLVQSAYNQDTLVGLVKLIKNVVYLTFVLELIGTIGYCFVFIPEYGSIGVWYSVFHSVSAFCNAGIDILGGSSFLEFRDSVMLNITTMFLIISGGIGFPICWEIVRVYRYNKSKQNKRFFSKFNTHTKLVLTVTLGLILVGALLTFIFEYDNPDTIGNLSSGEKIMTCLFQSVTLRTAGFATIDQSLFRHVTCVVYIIWMFIGGSPAGTAGGVKTVTVAILFASMMSNIKGNKDVVVFKRKISDDYVRRSVAIICFSMTTLFILTVALMYVQDGDFLDTFYEMTSAIATVGLSRGLTGELNTAGKLIVTLAMYLGRIGPITLALAFNSNKNKTDKITYAEAKVTIG